MLLGASSFKNYHSKFSFLLNKSLNLPPSSPPPTLPPQFFAGEILEEGWLLWRMKNSNENKKYNNLFSFFLIRLRVPSSRNHWNSVLRGANCISLRWSGVRWTGFLTAFVVSRWPSFGLRRSWRCVPTFSSALNTLAWNFLTLLEEYNVCLEYFQGRWSSVRVSWEKRSN